MFKEAYYKDYSPLSCSWRTHRSAARPTGTPRPTPRTGGSSERSSSKRVEEVVGWKEESLDWTLHLPTSNAVMIRIRRLPAVPSLTLCREI